MPGRWRRFGASGGESAGSLAWAVNAGAIRNRPEPNVAIVSGAPEHLYVAGYHGTFHAFDPATGTERWNTPVTGTGVHITQNIWAENHSPYESMIGLTDTNGDLRQALGVPATGC